ncbi:MAG: alpha/beta hydrolase [Patescibacteria group bacterium]
MRESGEYREPNNLEKQYDTQGRHYIEGEGEGEIPVGGKDYQYRVSFKRFGENDNRFPTNQRAIREVAPDLEMPHDHVVAEFWGWGETTAQADGDFLQIELERLRHLGYKNPKVVGINVSGRGTPEYMMAGNKEKISRISLLDETKNACDMTVALEAEGMFGKDCPISVIGHSMGYPNTAQFVAALNSGDSKRVKKLLAMMPANDKYRAVARPGFLWTVRNQVPPALEQWWNGGGSLELDEKDYHRIMLSDPTLSHRDQFERGVPDSALRFLELTLANRDSTSGVFRPDGAGNDMDITIVEGGRDHLIPRSSIDKIARTVGAKGLNNRVTRERMPDLAHFFPLRIRGVQREQIREVLGRFLSKTI